MGIDYVFPIHYHYQPTLFLYPTFTQFLALVALLTVFLIVVLLLVALLTVLPK